MREIEARRTAVLLLPSARVHILELAKREIAPK
jgi:hypothetical protein